MLGTQVMPPPCAIASALGQVSEPGSPGFGVTVPVPLQFTGFRIAGFEIAGNIEIVPADADDHVILDNDGRDASVIHLIQIADLLVPSLLAVLQVQRDEIAIGCFEVQPVLIYADAAIAEVNAAFRLPGRNARVRGRCARRPPRRDREA